MPIIPLSRVIFQLKKLKNEKKKKIFIFFRKGKENDRHPPW
jgi:hypothetical protein